MAVEAKEVIADARTNIADLQSKLQAKVGDVQVELESRGAQAREAALAKVAAAEKEAADAVKSQGGRIREIVAKQSEATETWRAIEQEVRFGFGARMQ